MKHTTSLLIILSIICASIAFAGDVKVRAVMTTDPEDEPVTSFTADTPKLFAMFKTTGITNGDKLRGVLIAEDVGDVAPANTKVLEKTLTLEEDTDDGDFAFSKPTKGWPVGKYRVERGHRRRRLCIFEADQRLAGGQISGRDLRERRSGEDGEVHHRSGQTG